MYPDMVYYMRDMVNAVLPWRFGVLMIEKTIYLLEKDAQNARRGALCVFCKNRQKGAGFRWVIFFYPTHNKHRTKEKSV